MEAVRKKWSSKEEALQLPLVYFSHTTSSKDIQTVVTGKNVPVITGCLESHNNVPPDTEHCLNGIIKDFLTNVYQDMGSDKEMETLGVQVMYNFYINGLGTNIRILKWDKNKGFGDIESYTLSPTLEMLLFISEQFSLSPTPCTNPLKFFFQTLQKFITRL